MITVMFSTYNGGEDLKRMLDGMTRMQLPPGGWQLIAVDNASTDGSGDVMRGYADRLPLTVLSEPRKGKNRALNRAVEEAKGDFLIFTDDDVLMREDWLLEWRKTADAQPDHDLFAGYTRPLWPFEPPSWLLEGVNVSVLFATHFGMQDGPCEVVNMYGTNMAVRGAIFRDGVRFDPTIGPDGSASYAMGSDTELGLRLEKQGLKCWFTTGPLIEHIVPPAYLEPTWILRRGYRWGRGLARMGFSFHCPPDVLARKNNLKWAVYPFMLPVLSQRNRWRRQWQCMVDRGYEDGTREDEGKMPRWTVGDHVLLC